MGMFTGGSVGGKYYRDVESYAAAQAAAKAKEQAQVTQTTSPAVAGSYAGGPAQYAPISPGVESPALTGLKAQTTVQADAARQAAEQQAALDAAAAAQTAGFGTAARTQQGEIDTGARTQQGEIETAGRTQAQQLAAQQEAAEAQLQSDAEGRRLKQLPQIMDAIGMGSSSDTTTTGGGGVEFPDISGAQNAAWLRAKDRTANTYRGALNALQNQMVTRGVEGGGIEAANTRGILGQGAGELSDVAREQAINDIATQMDIAKTKYQGGITQRGQNVSLAPSLLGLFSARY
jgi:hypothetical protein